MDKPTVSVILPVYNGEEFLHGAIASILEQSFHDFELLIINDCSTDNSGAIIDSFRDARIRHISLQRNSGVSIALNTGLSAACGRYAARMDSDDVALPDRLARQVAFLDEHPDIFLCGSWVETFGQQQGKKWQTPSSPEELKVRLLFENPFYHPSVMFRLEIESPEEYCYREECRSAQDFDLWLRLSLNHRLSNIPEVLLKYNLRVGSITDAVGARKADALLPVFTEYFKVAGIPAGDEELRTHAEIAAAVTGKPDHFVSAAEKWLTRLLALNAEKQIYDSTIFNEVVGETFFRICYRNGGRRTIPLYFSSHLRHLAHPTLKKRLKFVFHHLFRTPA